MLIQSNGGKVYAVMAANADYEVAIMPGLHLVSTSVFLLLRLRYKSKNSPYFDPMLVPKCVLVGGIERSGNTLRGNLVLKTNFTINNVGKSFPALMAERLAHHGPQIILAEDGCLTPEDMREDFEEDFAKLVESAISPIYPAKDFTGLPALSTPFDLALFVEEAGEAEKPLHAVQDAEEDHGTTNVTKLPFPAPTSEPETDDSPA